MFSAKPQHKLMPLTGRWGRPYAAKVKKGKAMGKAARIGPRRRRSRRAIAAWSAVALIILLPFMAMMATGA